MVTRIKDGLAVGNNDLTGAEVEDCLGRYPDHDERLSRGRCNLFGETTR